jgi:sortase A
MDNKDGGMSSASRQQMTATELARKRVLEAYQHRAQDYRAPTENSPAPQIKQEDWKKYHSAWQDYYQKYYGEYYGKAAREYVARERLRLERQMMDKQRKEQEDAASKVPEKPKEIIHTITEESQEVQNDFRSKIQSKAQERAKKVRKSKHFIPLTVGLVILVGGLLLQYNQVIAANIVAYVSPGNSEVTEITEIDPTVAIAVHENPTLMIPKLNVEVPITFGSQTDVKSMNVAMANGVANFSVKGASARPGEIGNFVVSGHSAGNVYGTSDYKFIFSGLTRMEAGDKIYVDYNGVRYTYRVQGTKVVEPTDVQSLAQIANDNEGVPMITLITCTPLGTSRYRLLVYAEQINPSYENAVTPAPSESEGGSDSGVSMPSNQDTPLEAFWKWLTGQQ